VRRWLFAIALFGACGRLRFDPLDSDALVEPPADAALSAAKQSAYLKASNPRANSYFGIGFALSADGSTLAVGAPGESSAATGINGDQTDTSALDAGAVYVFTHANGTWTQQAYIKASNTRAGDSFGISVALSADGSTLAVGAYFESAVATTSGAVYVFTRSGATWSQQAYLKASTIDPDDRFGDRVALSGDGSTLVIGAYFEDSAATGVGGNETDDSAMESGAAYVFTRSGTTWSQQAYLKASNTAAQDFFSYSLALSADGSTLAIAAPQQASVTGAVYVFTRTGTTWTQQAFIKASNADVDDWFGINVALSADASTLAVGAYAEDGNARTIDGDQTNNAASAAGSVYVYTRNATAWQQQAYIKASNTDAGDQFGASVALSGDGATLAVGALFEASGASGINGNQADNSMVDAGAAYVFTRVAGVWQQELYLKASNPDINDELGLRVALSQAGGTLAVCSYQEGSGVVGDQTDNSAMNAGAVYIFE